MIKIALFNHKGGVGKTTLTINIADALVDLGKTVLVADSDPQCNLTSFYMDEAQLESLLSESNNPGEGATLWSAVKPVVEGRGDILPIRAYKWNGVYFLPGDVLLADYEEELSSAWTDCFARRQRGYSVTTALSRVVAAVGRSVSADVCLYDVGPNIGALNRAIILDCDYFVTPVAADLFSLRALTTVGRAVSKWYQDWQTIRALASPADLPNLLVGHPTYAGYITSAFKVNQGRNAANPHADWEKKIAPRVRDKVQTPLRRVAPSLAPPHSPNKIGGIKHFHSLAPDAQKHGVAIGKLRGHVNPGHYSNVDEARRMFAGLAREIVNRTGI